MSRFTVLMLWLFSFGAFCCEIETEHSVTFYSSSCPIKTASSRTTEPVFLQFKFSGKSQKDIIREIKTVQRKLNIKVSAQKASKGYRLLLGPVAISDVAHFSQQLKSQGYGNALLKTVPPSSVANIVAPTTSSSGSLRSESTFAKVLGEVAQRKLFAVVDSNGRLIKTSYSVASKACATIGHSATIASQDEYVALLSSLYVLQLLGNIQAMPFWLDQQWVAVRLEEGVEKRQTVTGASYYVVCSFDG